MQPSEQANERHQSLAILNEHHSWPTVFAFKFIVPSGSSDALRALMPGCLKVETRPSAGGKYQAFTFHLAVGSAEEVLEVYSRVKAIPGLIAL